MRSSLLSGLALFALFAAPAAALAQELAGAPDPIGGPPRFSQDAPIGGPPRWTAPPAAPVGGDPHAWSPTGRRRRASGGECYAQVRYPASYAPPPSGPEYVWTQAPAPPGAPGPVWCLTVRPFPSRPVEVAPARLGWIRVLCADEATPERVSRLQRRLHERGLYRGEIDGRYDEETASAVVAFQRERHIEHRGYLSYQTLTALEVPPPLVVYPHAPTTYERGYVSWPGKSRYW
jgi:hypothetical protein